MIKFANKKYKIKIWVKIVDKLRDALLYCENNPDEPSPRQSRYHLNIPLCSAGLIIDQETFLPCASCC